MTHLLRTNQITLQLKLIISIIIFSVITRIAIPPVLGHSFNFSPIDAIALFCGACFNKRYLAFLITLLSVWIGDLVISKMIMGEVTVFYQGWYWQYACYVLITGIGMIMAHKVKFIWLIVASISSALLFFIISNFGVWYGGHLYPYTINGLLTCYIAGMPFFKNTVLSDVFFSTVLFAGFKQIQIKLPMQCLRKFIKFSDTGSLQNTIRD